MVWSRNTSWRQGHILAQKDFHEAGLPDSGSCDLAIAISHDCDIANDDLDVEPSVEFVCAQRIEKQDGNYTNGKNPRILHLNYKFQDDDIFLELRALDKFTVPKSGLEKIRPDAAYEMSSSRQILQSWLAVRYRRHALPNSLVDRLREVFGYMEKEGKKNSYGVLSFRLSYEPMDELPPEESYELWLSILYVTDRDEYEPMAKQLAEGLKAKFPKLLEKNKDYGSVDLRKCEAVSDMEFTMRDMLDTVEYHLEHLSHRSEPPGPSL
jgi:hypothetical protein